MEKTVSSTQRDSQKSVKLLRSRNNYIHLAHASETQQVGKRGTEMVGTSGEKSNSRDI